MPNPSSVDPNLLILAIKNWRASLPLFVSAVFTFFVFNGFKIPQTKEEVAGVVAAGLLAVLAASVKANTVASLPQDNTVAAVTVPNAATLVAVVDDAKDKAATGAGNAKLNVTTVTAKVNGTGK